MTVTAHQYRYHLPQKAIKSDCPDCGPKHRKTLSRYVDSRTGEPLPEGYGRCDRESNCGYHLSPYTKGLSGQSYADAVYKQWKADTVSTASPAHTRRRDDAENRPETRFSQTQTSFNSTSSPSSRIEPLYAIPDEVFRASLGHYGRNQLATLLRQHFGMGQAGELLNRFQIGTSAHWPGACVFWLKDLAGRVRGGQVVLFDHSGHTAKRPLPNGALKRCTGWVHTALASRYAQRQQPTPNWLSEYIDQADKFPIPFGLHQLRKAPPDQAVAIVESPKTALFCAGYFPRFVWMAIGGLSYLKAERLTDLRSRRLVLFPDLNAYHDRVNQTGQLIRGWRGRVDELSAEGFSVRISDYLERQASAEEKVAGLDLADYLLSQWPGYPPEWDSPT